MLSAVGQRPSWISEPLPPDYPHQAAHSKASETGIRGSGYPGGIRRILEGPFVSDWRQFGTVGGGAPQRRRAGLLGTFDGHFWPRERSCRDSAALRCG